MTFWHRKARIKQTVATPTIQQTVPQQKPGKRDTDAWIPEYARPSAQFSRVQHGPFRQGLEAQLVQKMVDEGNAVLLTYGVHASQVDGGLAYRSILEDEDPQPFQNSLRKHDVVLEHRVRGLGLSFTFVTYHYDGIVATASDQNYDLRASYGSAAGCILSYMQHAAPTFSLLSSPAEEQGMQIANLLAATEKTLNHENVPVTPSNIVSRIALEVARPVALSPKVSTGFLLPHPSSGGRATTYVPQLYLEYLRAELPFTFLVAAFLPSYRREPFGVQWDHAPKREWAPRFGILDAHPLKDLDLHPSLLLDMLGASREVLIETAT